MGSVDFWHIANTTVLNIGVYCMVCEVLISLSTFSTIYSFSSEGIYTGFGIIEAS